MTARLTARFTADRPAFVPYIMGGDPDLETSWELLRRLPDAGADLVELGFPFSDPTADGPAIQAAGQRALKAGTRLEDVLALATRFRAAHPQTPLILMGYANPAHARGWGPFAAAAAAAGADGAIIVDLPPEEDGPLNDAMRAHDLALIRLATPTSDANRLDTIVENARGFLYYVSVTGVTGTVSAAEDTVAAGLELIRRKSDLPIAVGFGVRTAETAAAVARRADAVVVGSALVEALAEGGVDGALALARTLAAATHGARSEPTPTGSPRSAGGPEGG